MFWNNFVNLCNNKGKSPNGVCADLGYSTAIATKWKNGAVPRDTTLKKIADYFGVPVSALTEPSPSLHGNAIILDPTKTRMIAVYESVGAGFGVVAQDSVTEYMPIYIHYDSEANETICIKVTGDSMSPEIENGDVIQVHKQSSVDSGSIAVVLIDGEEALVKKVIYDESHIELHSFNTAYPPVSFRGADLMRIQILGLVKGTVRNTPHRVTPDLNNKIAELSEDLSTAEQQEVEQFIAYLKSKRQ
jgi:repressor LexA